MLSLEYKMKVLLTHTIIKKQRLLLETASASFLRMSVKEDFCRNEMSDSFLYVLYTFSVRMMMTTAMMMT